MKNNEKSFNRFPPSQEGHGKAFTLVELIVVITILAILGTIAFLSLQGYSKNARDGVRTSDMKNIEKGLGIMIIKSGILPTPDDTKINIMSSGTIIGYQGYAGKLVQAQLGLSKDSGKDPLDGTYYTYLTNATKTQYQLLGFLEGSLSKNEILGKSYALDYTSRNILTYGKEMGVLLLNSGTTLNQPAQELYNGNLEILTGSTSFKAVLNSTDTIIGTGNTLQNLQFSYKSGNGFNAPLSCPTGFISVPGDKDFNQPGFCVAKYEMKQETGDAGNYFWNGSVWVSNGNTTSSYCSDTSICNNTTGTATITTKGKVVSKADGYPVTWVNQYNAMEACKSMGAGYHLITNNEWMTIARNIEQQTNNWTGGLVGVGAIYSGHNDNNPANSLTASIQDTDGYNQTGNGVGSNQRRTHTLSNGQTIWDLAGNVWEHVNGANTINGSNYNTMQAQACGRTDTIWNWNSFYGNDGVPACNYSNGYTYSNQGPKTPNLNANNGVGRIYDYGGNTYTDRVFVRGGDWDHGSYAGLFTLSLAWSLGNAAYVIGFRCAL